MQLIGRLLPVSNIDSKKLVAKMETVVPELAPDDHSWLKERLEEYGELLSYLHDH